MKVIAHRGNSSEAPENTLVAFKQAVDLGADFLEFDVHLSAEGIPVVIHDENVLRTTNSKQAIEVHSLSYKSLRELDAGSWYSEVYKNESIPTLESVFRCFQGQIGFMVEVKGVLPSVGCVAEKVAEVVNMFPNETIYIGSFESSIVEALSLLLPENLLISIVESEEGFRKHQHIQQDIFAFDFQLLSEEYVKEIHKNEKSIWAWTVNEDSDIERLISLGVDGAITNFPKRVQALLR